MLILYAVGLISCVVVSKLGVVVLVLMVDLVSLIVGDVAVIICVVVLTSRFSFD